MIVRDSWHGPRRENLAEGCETRLRELVDQSGWTRRIMQQLGTRLGLDELTSYRAFRQREDSRLGPAKLQTSDPNEGR